jgi:hypothetical protein
MSAADAKEMPDLFGNWQCEFEPQRREVSNPLLGGDADAFEVSAPRWGMKFTMSHASDTDFATMRGWVLSLRGGQISLLAWDRKHPRLAGFFGVADLTNPSFDSTSVTCDDMLKAFDSTIEPWGNPSLVAINTATRTITLDGLSASAIIFAGDPISWFDGRNWVLVKASETRAAVAGTVSSLPVEPRLAAHPDLTGYHLPIYVRVVKACCEMRVDPSSINIPNDDRFGGSVGFDAYQTIRRT